MDPTGAGDSFAGGFTASLVADSARTERDALRRAVVYGSALASLCVEGVGPERLIAANQREVQARLNAFRALAAIPAHESVQKITQSQSFPRQAAAAK